MGETSFPRLARVSEADGTLDTSWHIPDPDRGVLSLSLKGDSLIVGGNFMTLGGDDPAFLAWFGDGAAPDSPARGGISALVSQSINGSWSATAGANSYTLVASLNNANPPNPIFGSISTSLTNGIVTGLTPNTTFYLFVNACNSSGCSPYTSLGSTTTLASAPSLTLGSVGATSVQLTITPNGNPGGTVYVVQQSADNGFTFTGVSTGTALTVTLTGLNSGTHYQFRVAAQNQLGTLTTPSAVVLATPGNFSTDTARAYPVPFRPGHGRDTITFDQLPSGATIKLYTMRGQLVRTLAVDGNQVDWDVANQDGQPVATGVYYAFVDGPGGKKTFKVAVQR